MMWSKQQITSKIRKKKPYEVAYYKSKINLGTFIKKKK